jgi:fructose 1,6-bisphosphatase
MKTTLTVIKADVGSIGGHIAPSEALVDAVHDYVAGKGAALLLDHSVGYTGIAERLAVLDRRFTVRRERAIRQTPLAKAS